MDTRYPGLPKATGYYVEADMADFGPGLALMSRDRAFHRGDAGGPVLDGTFAYHLDNATFVRWLETACVGAGVALVDGTVADVQRSPLGVAGLFVGASSFRSVLMRGAVGGPWVDYSATLWCDRAVIGGWHRRAGEAVHPYTLVETMDAGWNWQIDHDRRVNRGHVYCSAFLDDAAAEAEFRRRNPLVDGTRAVPFPNGRAERAWVGNVLAVGNAYGFVEPPEATNLGFICSVARNAAEVLADCDGDPADPHRLVMNAVAAEGMDAIRWFPGLHYKFNDRVDTPFWRAVTVADGGTDVTGAQPLVDWYVAAGPSGLCHSVLLSPHDPFGIEGWLAVLVGQRVPYRRTYAATPAERSAWARVRAGFAAAAERAVPVEEAIGLLLGRRAFVGTV